VCAEIGATDRLSVTVEGKDRRLVPNTLSAIAYKTAKDGEFVVPGFGKLVKQKRKARTEQIPQLNRRLKFLPEPSCKGPVLGVELR
jgi:nucleoid DNA-binding protein